MPYQCNICGQAHEGLPDIGFAAPFQCADELANNPTCLLTEDLCIIEGRDFFVRGVIHIPVFDEVEGFGFGVWVSHKKENFEIYREHFDTASIGPFFGWLCSEIEFYPESTLGLKSMTHYQGKSLRPHIVLEESDHPLCRQQRNGISLSEAWSIVHQCVRLI